MHPLMTWSGRDPARRFEGGKRMSASGTLRTRMPPPGMSPLRGKADTRGATLSRPQMTPS